MNKLYSLKLAKIYGTNFSEENSISLQFISCKVEKFSSITYIYLYTVKSAKCRQKNMYTCMHVYVYLCVYVTTATTNYYYNIYIF